ncbi:MAG: hypothetical protein ABIZ18_10365 [Caldimonas sp.]
MVRGFGIAATTALWLLTASAASAGPLDRATPADAAPVGPTLADGSFRSAFVRGRLDLGVTFDAPLRALHPGEAPIDPVIAYVPPVPTLSVGLRSTPAGAVATAGTLFERATGATLRQPPERKVGLEWKPAQSRIFLNRGLGIRLDGDDRFTMRLKRGSLGIFMKTTF